MFLFGVVVVAMIVVAYVVHRVLLTAAQRGWIYYGEHRHPAGAGLDLLSSIYSPEMEHVIEEEAAERVRREDAESGRGDGDDPVEDEA
jgi:hypothetical protein